MAVQAFTFESKLCCMNICCFEQTLCTHWTPGIFQILAEILGVFTNLEQLELAAQLLLYT